MKNTLFYQLNSIISKHDSYISHKEVFICKFYCCFFVCSVSCSRFEANFSIFAMSVNWDQNLHKSYKNCPSYTVVPENLTDLNMLELAMFHFIVPFYCDQRTKYQNSLQYFGSIIQSIGVFEIRLNLMTWFF